MTSEEVMHRVHVDPNFINLKRFDYDISRLLHRYPDGVPVRLIAASLCITEEEVHMIYEDVVGRLRERLTGDREL